MPGTMASNDSNKGGHVAGKRESMSRAELLKVLLDLRYDMDCIGESFDLSEELQNLSNEELKAMIEEYSD